MRSNSLKALAIAEIFIMLSVCPINAYRVTQAGKDMANLESTQEVVQALRDALAEDTAEAAATNGTHDYFWETFASCSQRKEDFERRTQKLKDRYDEASKDGKMTLTEAAWVILKARVVAKTVQKAEAKGCAWAKDKEAMKKIDTTSLQALQKEVAPKSPCYEVTKEKLERAKDKDAASQNKAVVSALSGFLAKDCKPSSKHNSTEVKQVMAVTDEEEEEDAVDLATKAGEAEEEEVTKMEDEMKTLKTAMLQVGEGLSADSADAAGEEFIGFLFVLVTVVICFIVLVMMLTILCGIALTIFLIILGLIMCLIKMFVVKLLRLFGSSAWDLDFEGCLDWWLTPLQYEEGTPIMAVCFVGVMITR